MIVFFKRLVFTFLALLLFTYPGYSVNWYTLASGDWDDPTVWTLDPSGSLPNNPDSYTPSTSPTAVTDEVKILSGRTITVSSDGKTNAKLTVLGRIDFKGTTGHTFTEIRGSGKIILKADNFPSGDATHFISKDQGEGTVVFDSTGYDLNTAHTFYNVEIDLDNATDILTLIVDYQIDGDLTITSGMLQINDNSGTTAINLTVEGTTTVAAGNEITVGTGNAVHTITFNGDLTNNGSIDLANDAQYSCPSTGAAEVTFGGASDNTLTCNGTTDFYRLFLDKGTDDTYILEVVSTNTANFRLFGPVSGGGCLDAGAEGWENLALVLHNGTLKLGSNIDIPILGADRSGTASPYEFHIPYTARLWIDGADVSTHTSAGGWRGITIFGTLQISSGTFTNPSGTGGITYFNNTSEPGKILIEGGTVSTTQVKQASASGRFSYIQTGGTLNINALSDSRGSSAVFALPHADFAFQMSGGLIQISAVNTTATNGIDIQCDEGNINVTGGTIELLLPTLDAASETQFEVYSTAPFYNLTLTDNGAASQPLVLQSSLTILNDLTIGAGTEFDAAGNDLSITGDLIIEDGGTFTHNNNTTYFIGDQNSVINIENTGNIPGLTFYDLVINKDQKTNPSLFWDLSIAECSGRSEAAADEIILIENNLTITRGQFTTERYTVSLEGDLSITDGKLVYNSALPGRLMLEGSAQQSITGSAIYTPSFGHIDLNNANGATIATDVSLDYFTLTQGIMDINEYRFTIDTCIVEDATAGGFDNSNMIMTNGLAGDRGLKLTFNLDASTPSGTYISTFPVGISGEYTPVEVWLENSLSSSYSGTFTVNPVDGFHPSMLLPTIFLSIPYYWKSEVTGDLGSIDPGDIFLRFTHDNVLFFNFKRKYLEDYDFVTGTPSNNVNSSPWIYEDIGFLTTDYTVCDNISTIGTNVYYSRQSGDWDDRNTWSFTGHTGNRVGPASVPPGYNDIVIIKGDGTDNHVVTMDINNGRASQVYVLSADPGTNGTPTLDLGTTTGHTFDEIHGGGLIRISYNGDIPAGDWESFVYNDTAILEYYGGSYTIPTDFTVYPNLLITGTGDKTMANQDILVRKNLTIDGETLIVNNGDDIYIDDSLIVDNAGVLQFPTNANPCIVTVNKAIDLSRNSAANTIEIATGGSNTSNHSLYLSDDINLNANSVIDLYDAADNAVDLYFEGDDNSQVNNAGASIDLNRLIITKTVTTSDVDFLEAFTLNGPTDGTSSEKALYLISGDLTINNASIDIDLTTGGGDFKIPSDASLSVLNATVNASGNNTGIYLDGLMNVGTGSQWLLNGGTNNYIEYSATGNAQITIDDGTLRVGSQIRRNTLTTEGILNFSQNSAASTVIIGETDAPENSRGVLEILNAGSEFTQVNDATITIVQSQTIPSFPALYLDPSTSSLGSGSGFIFGNASTLGSNNMGIYSSVDLQNVTVDGTNSPTLTEWTIPLTINEDLVIESTAEFDANGLDLTVNGDFLNYGTFTPNNNTTYISGTGNQRLYGNTNFYNLTKTSTTELWLAYNNADISVTNNFDFQAGTLRDSSNTITLFGDCNFDGTHIHGAHSGNGIYFNGTSEQELTGSGIFGKITIDNSSGITVPLGNNFTVTDTVKLMNGVFTIGKNLLTLTVDAEIEEANPFSASNMIQTNVSFTDYGVRKYLPSGAKTFVYPIGSGGKYTPVSLDISANSSSTGYITIKAADEMHASIQEDSEAPDTEITDADNVLQYHWVVRANNISNMTASAEFTYDPGDVEVTSPYDITDYIPAQLLNDGSGEWNKYDEIAGVYEFDETNEVIIFNLPGVADDEISGDYTAGVDGFSFNGAIPDQVPSYETNSSGTWATSTIWTPNVSGGPRGAITKINSGHTVTTASNYVSSYTTEIQGTVDLGTTIGHRFGEVTGTGRIITDGDRIPAGIYDDFFSSAGGTLEYSGTTDHDVLGEQALVNNLVFSGTGERRLPSADLVLNGDLEINGGAGLAVNNDNNIDIEIRGDLTRTSGSFDAGTDLGNIISFTSSVTQTITGDFTGSNTLNTLEVDNANGVTLAGDVDIASTLTLTNGVINTGGNTLTIALNASISPTSGTSSQHVEGALTKVLTSSQDFVYPVGDNSNLGVIKLIDVNGWGGGTGEFSAEYLFANPITDIGSAMDASLNTVSQSEYWSVLGPAGGQSTLEITLDGSSDVANALSDINDLVIVGWDGSQWEPIGGNYTITGTSTSGTISCDTDIDYDTYQYITLGSDQVITLITATIVSGDVDICNGSSTDITLAFTGGVSPWLYTINGTEYSAVTSPYNHTVSPTVTTTYTLEAVRDSDSPSVSGNVVGNADVVITVNSAPTPTLSSSSNPSCENVAVVFTAGTGTNYEFYVGAAPVQSGTANTYTTSTLPVGNSTVDVIVTSSDGCSSVLGIVPVTQTVNANPTPSISGDAVSCENAIVTYTSPATANTFTWSVDGGTLQSAQGTNTMDIQWDTLLPVGTTSDTGTVTVTESDGTCEGTDIYSVTIYRIPQTGPQNHIKDIWGN